MENALFARFLARVGDACASVGGFFRCLGQAGRQKLTIMLIPHTEKRIVNIQLSFFGLGGILLGAGIVACAFIFAAARFSDTAGRLHARSSDLASTQASLDAIRDQTGELVTAAKRFESALSGTLVRIGARPSEPGSPSQSGDLASFFETRTIGSGSVREIGELKRVTDYLERSVDPLKEIGSMLENQGAVLTEIPNIWPIKGGPGHVSMYYGQNENPFTGQWYIHKGVDISTYRTGDPVVSSADGTVVALGFDNSLGNYIIVQHSHGFITRYAHLMAFRVQKGQKVQQGQVIGLVGNTGMTTGPHLHYEVHLGTGVTDPLRFLNIRANASSQSGQGD
jgi:murein DD-endopeptidase MepM/ murein hydrolase activator NlpD